MKYRLFIDQLFTTLGSLREAFDLIKERRLWRGLNEYGWVMRVLVIAAVVMGLYFMGEFWSWMRNLWEIHSFTEAVSSMGIMASNMAQEGYASFTSGLMKYVVLLLSEVLIFHFMQRSLQEIQDKPIRTDFQAFWEAQIRMLKVVIRTWALELVVTIIISIGFGIFGFLEWLEPFVLWVAQCYFLGLVILDNYNEQFGLSIKESIAFSRQLMGVALALGSVLYLCMLIPFVGAIGGTIWVSVTAVWAMKRLGVSVPIPAESMAENE